MTRLLTRTTAWVRRLPGSRSPVWDRVCVAWAGGLVLLTAATIALRVGDPYELSFVESGTVEVSARVADHRPIYGAPSAEFVPWPYPPFYFWLTGLVLRVTGVTLPWARSVSVVSLVAVLVFLVVTTRKVGGDHVAGMLAAGIFAGTYRVSGAWFDVARVDMLFLALLLASVVTAMVARTPLAGFLAGLLAVAAFLTKQNAVIALGPVLVALVFRSRAAGIAALAVAFVGCVGSLTLGNWVTAGWYTESVIGQLLGHPVDRGWLGTFWVVDLLLPFAVVGALAVTVLWWTTGRGLASPQRWRVGWERLDQPQLVGAAASVGLLVAALAGRLHTGGYANVAMPAHAVAAVGAALGTRAALGRLRASPVAVAAVVMALLLQTGVWLAWRASVVPTQADRAAGEAFVTRLRSLPGPVVVVNHPYYARLAGSPPRASSFAARDVLDSRPGRLRDALVASLPWDLDGVGTVVVDDTNDAALVEPGLSRSFTRLPGLAVPDGLLVPPSDQPARPSQIWVRTSLIALGSP